MWNVQCNRKYLLILHKNVTGQQRSCKVNISVRRTGTGTKIKLKIQINWKNVISRSIDHSGKKSMLKLLIYVVPLNTIGLPSRLIGSILYWME